METLLSAGPLRREPGDFARVQRELESMLAEYESSVRDLDRSLVLRGLRPDHTSCSPFFRE